MDLWIRSQNKGALIKVEMLGNTDGTIKSYLGNNQTVLGTYKSGERVLEILDEIQEAQLGNYHYRCPSNVKVSNNEDTIVYEMPQE